MNSQTFVNCFAINKGEEVSRSVFMGNKRYKTALLTALGARRWSSMGGHLIKEQAYNLGHPEEIGPGRILHQLLVLLQNSLEPNCCPSDSSRPRGIADHDKKMGIDESLGRTADGFESELSGNRIWTEGKLSLWFQSCSCVPWCPLRN